MEGLRDQVDRLSDTIRRLQSHEAAMRVFTAESSGAVHAGRFRPVRRLALPATESG